MKRREMLKMGALATGSAGLASPLSAQTKEPSGDSKTDPLPIRMLVGDLPNPYVTPGGFDHPVWTRPYWESTFAHMVETGYNSLVYYANPWTTMQWQSYMIQNTDFPEAREHSVDEVARIVDHLQWLFARGHDFGISGFLFCHYIYTPRPFAEAHGYAKDLPVSMTVHGNHNNAKLEYRWGVRDERTREYTEATTAEVLKTYPDLDGLMGTMGESMPGKRSTWYAEAVVPGMLRAGRKENPPYILFHWIMPFDDFKEDILEPNVYDKTWLSIEHNGEGIDSVKPYPISVRWAEESGLPTIVQIVNHNVDGEWNRGGSPQIGSHDSPKFAYEIIDQYKRIKNVVGFNYTISANDNSNPMFKQSLAYYASNHEEYSDDRWLDHLETRYGTREAAKHILEAFDIAARITPEVGALAWCPHDLYIHARLSLRFWFFDEETSNFAYFSSAAREGGLMLMPVRYYAKAVARERNKFHDNTGGEVDEHHPSQELIWGHIDYGETPEAHMRKVKEMGEQCLAAMKAAMPHVTQNKAEAEIALHYMKSHELLTIYYEKKVQAAISAQIYRFGREQQDREDAIRFAGEAFQAYETAIGYVKEHLDENRNNMRSKWRNEYLTLDELIEKEKEDRDNIANLFKWPGGSGGQTPIRFEEDWNSGAIDSERWIVNAPGTTRCELEELESGDWALVNHGSTPTLEPDLQHQNSLYSVRSFSRGGNLRCTFKAWGDPSKPTWNGAFPSTASINGPWRSSNSGTAVGNQEACVSLWKGQPMRFSQEMWDTGPALSEAFDEAWTRATSKEKAITIRVWLGDEIGAKCEWSLDGSDWIEEADTRGVSGGDHPEVYLGFASYAGAVFIDDIVVENDFKTKKK